MAYILLIFGVLIGGYALYVFLRRASREQARAVLLSLAIGITILLIFVLILSGRLVIAAILTAVLIPLLAKLYSSLGKFKK